MEYPLFDRVADVETLDAAWLRVRANDGSAGGDGVSIARFGLVAAAQIDRLSQALQSGQYRPGPARRVYIPKASGGVRTLDIPCVSDRVVQAAAAAVLDPLIDPQLESTSFAYRKGRSVAQAVARVAMLRRQGYDHVIDGDIVSYFERIEHERLITKLERALAAAEIEDRKLVDLIWLWLEAYSLTGRGVPQGSPISPLLSNLYLDAVDEAIESGGMRLVRFADDWLILTKGADVAGRALGRVTALLAAEGLEVHPDKTRIVSFDEGFRFLGHLFVKSLVVKEIDEDDTPGEDAVAAAETALAAAKKADQEAARSFPEADEPEDISRPSPVFPVYMVEPGRRLEARGERLSIVDDLKRIIDLPPARLNRIEIGPGADATLDALDTAIAHDIAIWRVNGHGEPLWRVDAEGPQRAHLHLAQAAIALDPARRAALACTFARARVHNQRALLRRLNRERNNPDIADAAAKLSRVIRKYMLPLSVEQAMGVEGEAAALFWPAYGRAFPDGFRFIRRTRQPAGDAVNIVLNVFSSLLARDIRTALIKVGLHPGFGSLHSARDGEEALVYDLIEEFRGPICEAATAALFNRKALRAEHFSRHDGQTFGLKLEREGYMVCVRSYEAWLARVVASPRSGRQLLWRAVLLDQARAYAAHVLAEEPELAPYVPYMMDY